MVKKKYIKYIYMTSVTQAIIFDKFYWSPLETRKWLIMHHLIPIKPMHETKKFYRYRLRDPKDFKRIRTIKTKDHLDIIIGYY
jgi:hypothetical protein